MITRSIFHLETRAKGASRQVDVVASTEDTDAHGDSIVMSGLSLRRYLANPVVLNGHRGEFPIGSASNIRIEENKLHATITLVDERANPDAERVYQSCIQGSLRGVSIGFIPIERDGNRVTKSELVEISVVPVPSNPNALVTEVRSMPTSLQTARTTEPRWHGKTYAELTFAEKHTLASEDPKLWDRMRGVEPKPKPDPNAVPKWNGKEYFELSFEERHELANTDEGLFHAMREHSPLFEGKSIEALSADEELALYKNDRARWQRMNMMR